ncbi:MAG: Dam family site-specific DNA-(adenine-N6)-methyltransferase [Candidatus Altiarchaeales archaeon]|nr:Dam family site-specific DNA-(adenine-N6)-methyltransferase [Candidatus Altiarchaeales archaeon]
MHKPILKWAGGKTRLVPRILEALPAGSRLVEPFCGSCAVSLNAPGYERYWLNDANQPLIQFYTQLDAQGDWLIKQAKDYYAPARNTHSEFEKIRSDFNGNHTAEAFLYLNRHCFNGLWRVNSKGGFNVPYGKYKAPYFPEKEMRHFLEHFNGIANFTVKDFREVFQELALGDVVYADPPYLPLTDTADFTSYTAGGFSLESQKDLAACAEIARDIGVPVIISNHDTPLAREIFGKATKIDSFSVRRSIAAKGSSRGEVKEILAHYLP